MYSKPVLLLSLLLVALVSSCGLPPQSSADLPEIDIPYQKHILPNGLTVILHEDHKAPIVAVNIWYHVGSKDEQAGRTGFAHLFEHLMFQGSENYDDEFFRPLEQVGATDLNGTTNWDRTNYFANVPTTALDRLLWMESDRMGHLLGAIDQAKLDEQREVVKNEKRQRENVPYGKVWELIAENTYPEGHPYSWPIIGYMEDLDAASLDDVKNWFRTHYGAANAVLVIAGDINPQEALEKVEHYFGDIPAGPPLSHHTDWTAAMAQSRHIRVEDRVPQARIYKVWNLPPGYSRDTNIMDLTAGLLAGGKTGRLYKRLVLQDQLATDVVAAVIPREIGSQFLVWATARADADLVAVEATLTQELDRFLAEGPRTDEISSTRMRMFANILRGSETIGGSSGKSDILASSEVYGGTPDAYRQELEWLESATAADIRNTSRHWLRQGNLTVEVVPFNDYSVSRAGADRSKLPDTGTPPDLKLPDFQRTTLDNGLQILLAQRTETPLVELSLVFDAGYAADSMAGKPGVASLTLDMLDEGADGQSNVQISSILQSLGSSVSSGASLDTAYIDLSGLPETLDKAMDVYADVVRRPDFPADELERLKQQQVARIKQEQSRPFSLALRVLPPLLFGETHPYGIPLTGSGNEDSVMALGRDDLVSFHQRWIRPDNAVLVAVGDIDMPTLQDLVDDHFGNWKAPAEDKPVKSLETPQEKKSTRVYLLNRPGATQSTIIAGQLAPPPDAEADIPYSTLNAVLGGMFTSRINMNLREDKGWSYGARSKLVGAKGTRPYIAYSQVQSDKTAESIREIRSEIKDIMKRRPVTAAELASAQDQLTLKLPGEHETNSALLSTLTRTVVYGLPDDYYEDYVSRVRELKPADLIQAAKTLLKPDALTWIIVGDLDKISEPVSKLGLGPIQRLDADGQPIADSAKSAGTAKRQNIEAVAEPVATYAIKPKPVEPEYIERSLRVVATAFNSHEDQTDDDEDIAAWGDRLIPGMKVIAVSRDLLKMGLTRNARVRIDGFSGEYRVLDKMNKRWTKRIDIYMGEDEDAAWRWGKRNMTIRWKTKNPAFNKNEAKSSRAPENVAG